MLYYNFLIGGPSGCYVCITYKGPRARPSILYAQGFASFEGLFDEQITQVDEGAIFF